MENTIDNTAGDLLVSPVVRVGWHGNEEDDPCIQGYFIDVYNSRKR